MWTTERAAALSAVRQACLLCRNVQDHLIDDAVVTKEDNSPVTIADFGAQALVNMEILKAFPEDPIIGEEDSSDLQGAAGARLLEQVTEQVNRITDMTSRDILSAIDRGDFDPAVCGSARHWVLDPIDGTKGFLRKEQSAVALGLVVDGEVVFGVLGCPNLPVDYNDPSAGRGVLLVGGRGLPAFMVPLDGGDDRLIRVSSVSDVRQASFTESVEAGHSSHGHAAQIANILGVKEAPLRIDSQAKYGVVGRGDACVYLRLPTRRGYEEKVWDHAAGVAVIEAAGGRVTDTRGDPLDFSLGRTLRANVGVVVTNGPLHDRVLEAVRQVLDAPEHVS